MPAKRCRYFSVTDPDPDLQSESVLKLDQCKAAALRFAGFCTLCRKDFCGTHRLPEHHDCTGMETCREQAFERNKEKLQSERTVASKMIPV